VTNIPREGGFNIPMCNIVLFTYDIFFKRLLRALGSPQYHSKVSEHDRES
jgi:hypothetical protein